MDPALATKAVVSNCTQCIFSLVQPSTQRKGNGEALPAQYIENVNKMALLKLEKGIDRCNLKEYAEAAKELSEGIRIQLDECNADEFDFSLFIFYMHYGEILLQLEEQSEDILSSERLDAAFSLQNPSQNSLQKDLQDDSGDVDSQSIAFETFETSRVLIEKRYKVTLDNWAVQDGLKLIASAGNQEIVDYCYCRIKIGDLCLLNKLRNEATKEYEVVKFLIAKVPGPINVILEAECAYSLSQVFVLLKEFAKAKSEYQFIIRYLETHLQLKSHIGFCVHMQTVEQLLQDVKQQLKELEEYCANSSIPNKDYLTYEDMGDPFKQQKFEESVFETNIEPVIVTVIKQTDDRS